MPHTVNDIPVHGRVSVNVLLLAVGSLVKEEGGNGGVVVVGRPHQRSHARVISHVDVKVGVLWKYAGDTYSE